MAVGWETSLEETLKGAVKANAKSVAHRPLPPIPRDLKVDDPRKPPMTLCLFYQYIEPAWTPKQHRGALAFVQQLARSHRITGRGRCAREGLNCTMTGTAKDMRAFCTALRAWDPTFEETDFKLTDGLDNRKKFKSFTLQKKEELVAYGLPVDRAPSLKDNGTKHLEADQYHKMMAQPNTVIIDVRNHYEAMVGHFQPPPGGAEFIDPRVRNSHELPKWLAQEETREKLKGKQVLMYCTGGIRCERFSALFSQMKRDDPEFQTEGEFMVRGGIERYIKTFPEGGYWKGKNFLFDKRQEQVPELKSEEQLAKEVTSKCCHCKVPCGVYRGGFKCSVKECMVPIIICADCRELAAADPQLPKQFKCNLCEEGHSLRELDAPLLYRAQKRKANPVPNACPAKRQREKHQNKDPSSRLFVGNVPLVVDAAALRRALGHSFKLIHWIPDHETGLWYGNIFVEMRSVAQAKEVFEWAGSEGGIKMGKRRLRVNFAPPKDGEVWPPKGHVPRERPPIPVDPGA